ncbi:uncharacterized protein LOC112272541 [Brachypodium distachyon]|uniref:Uncharacterized protein n=1 Tax=Brachypodium distachyon TaxID=15368 RepID=A0A2K2CTK1_BRADI|nr:uncharacterized protein LOC112272541 [Brachypodium distachyon]PNT65359.1 hypothetical protein BRADI_4g41222v3 [Brachypodium distachyon]|eukprot:XP_024319435.1 uncharacterized protein LOC112272541 [Brachypodium distachyon]
MRIIQIDIALDRYVSAEEDRKMQTADVEQQQALLTSPPALVAGAVADGDLEAARRREQRYHYYLQQKRFFLGFVATLIVLLYGFLGVLAVRWFEGWARVLAVGASIFLTVVCESFFFCCGMKI